MGGSEVLDSHWKKIVAKAKLAHKQPKQSLLHGMSNENICNLLFVKKRSLTFQVTILVDVCKVTETERMD
jgi:hypothetical protein